VRFIQQQAEPRSLPSWIRDNESSPQNQHYGNLPSLIREEIKNSLRQEQGGLCGYTMKRIDGNAACHIEHIESQASAAHKTLDYSNMLACVPFNGGNAQLGYGAAFKGDKPVESPHGSSSIEQRFLYDNTGHVKARLVTDTQITQSIENLGLNHRSLLEDRLAALSAAGLPTRSSRVTKRLVKPLSVSQAKILAKRVLEPSNNGQLPPFCLVISQVAESYATQAEKIAQRLKGARAT
jgi:uncharacterized protein (TIGR02646 family)